MATTEQRARAARVTPVRTTPPPASPPPASPPRATTAPDTGPAETIAAVEGEQRRLNLETWFRGISLMLVVLALVLYPMYALIFNILGSTLSEVVAPVTGIAGAVVGYWFGQASRRIQTPSSHR